MVDVDCAVFAGVPPTVTVELTIEDAPAWLEAFVEERTLSANPATCAGGRTTLETELRLFWEPGAGTPLAGDPYGLTVRAEAADVRGNVFEASAPIAIDVGLMGHLRVTPGEVPALVSPGERVAFSLNVVNAYNAPATVELVPNATATALGVSITRVTVAPDERGVALFSANVPQGARDGSVLHLALAWNATAYGADVESGFADVQLAVASGPLGPPMATPSPAAASAPPAPAAPGSAGVPAPDLAWALAALAAVALARCHPRR